MRRLDGRVAIITGGSSGIGEACAERFAEEGAHVVVADIREPRRQASEESCELIYFNLDVTDEAAWLEMMSIVSDRWGRLDVLINAAGVSIDGDTVEVCTPESWRRTLEVNLDGTFLGCKHAVRTMKLLGGGAITNIASVLGIVADGDAEPADPREFADVLIDMATARPGVAAGQRAILARRDLGDQHPAHSAAASDDPHPRPGHVAPPCR